MKKLKNGSYKVAVIVEDGDFNLSDGSSFSGKFSVEAFEKNFGTFEEDIKINSNIDPEWVKINKSKTIFESLKPEIRSEIETIVLGLFNRQFLKFQYND